jgi:hypothetical protein
MAVSVAREVLGLSLVAMNLCVMSRILNKMASQKPTILLALLLLGMSSSSFSKVGDVYYCSKAQSVELNIDYSKNTTDNRDAFFKNTLKFKRDKKKLIFNDSAITVDKISYSSFGNYEASEWFWADKNLTYGLSYKNGILALVYFSNPSASNIEWRPVTSALYKCSIF